LQGKKNIGKDTGWADGKVYSQKNDAIQNIGDMFDICPSISIDIRMISKHLFVLKYVTVFILIFPRFVPYISLISQYDFVGMSLTGGLPKPHKG